MTTGEAHGRLWSRGAHDWATYMEPRARVFYRLVHDRLGIGEGTRLLDVGCGPGGSAELAAQRGAQVAGLDASPGSIEFARERVPGGDFRVGDMESLPWPDGSFDAVTGFNSFQFAGKPAAAFSEVRRVLAPGCKLGLVIWAPQEKSQQPTISKAVAALAPPLPTNAPGAFALSPLGVLEDALAAAGLRVVDGGDIPVDYDYPDVATAARAMMASGGTTRAIQHSGEERVQEAMLAAIEEFRTESGAVRIKNRFRFVIAEAA